MEPRLGGNGRGVLTPNFFHGAPVTSMVAPINKQGYLGDLEEKSKVELEELLERQEKILNNRRFVMKLPDKGQKIEKFAATLRELISKKESRETEGKTKNEQVKDEMENEASTPEVPMEGDVVNDMKIIERGFGDLSVHEGPFYQVVVKAEERVKQKLRFALNRPHRKETSDAQSSRDGSDMQSERSEHHLKDAELTSASVSDPVHGSATVLSVDECRTLYTDQQRKVQEIEAQHMVDRIRRRMHPEGSYGSRGRTTDEEGMNLEDGALGGESVNFEEDPMTEDLDTVD